MGGTYTVDASLVDMVQYFLEVLLYESVGLGAPEKIVNYHSKLANTALLDKDQLLKTCNVH